MNIKKLQLKGDFRCITLQSPFNAYTIFRIDYYF